MKIKKGDTVKMRSGKDQSKTGRVLRVLPADGRIVVEGLNMATKHQRPRRAGEKGQRIVFARAVSVSAVMLICTKCGKATRVGIRLFENGKRERICRKCKELI